MTDSKPGVPSAEIDRGSPVPFYFQLARALREEILSGRWPPEHRLPSEAELCESFGVARSTVRQALQQLESDRLIVKEKGRGAFVADSRDHSWLLQASEGFFKDETEREGARVTSRILRAERGPLPSWAADALGISAKRPEGVSLERLRWADGQLALHVVNYMPAPLADVVLTLRDDQSLYEQLAAEHGIRVGGGRRVVEALPAPRGIASLLEVPASTPLMFIESTSWDRDDEPFDCYHAWLRTDRMRIEIQVSSSSPGGSGSPDQNLLRAVRSDPDLAISTE